MKVCIGLRNPASANLRSDNLRSEARWERQALEASLENPEVSEVYTVGNDWQGSHPKYCGSVNGNVSRECILLNQDWNDSIINRNHFKAVFVNVFSGPWVEQIPEIKSLYNRLNGNLYFTLGFPVLYRNELNLEEWYEELHVAPSESHLEKFVPRDHILLLPVPGAPYISEGNNFDCKRLVWGQRLISMTQLGGYHTLVWSLQKLMEDPSISLDVITGWHQSEVKDVVNHLPVYKSDINKAFWELPAFAPFEKVRDRVRIHLELGWDQVLRIYSEAKLFTTHGRLFGGPPVEASLHGVPFVGSGKTGALCDCPEYLHVNMEPAACDTLEKLYTDRDYYTKTGNAYREYTKETYSYEAFNRNLNKLLADRNLP